jgi:tetratricopeptide (TPR) repeat protein
VPFERDGVPWRRLRIGFFGTAPEAQSALRALEHFFPGAWVVEAGRADRLAWGGEAAQVRDEHDGDDAGASVADADERTAAGSSDAAAWLDEARGALTRGELERAVALLTKALEAPAGNHRADARELLGVARERKGQLAHARAEYETYLIETPDGPGAERVRQRLDAVLTASSASEAPLRETHRAGEGLQIDTFGSA